MNAAPTAVAADDTRPVLRYSSAENSHTVAPRVFEMMKAHGGFYVRQRRGLQPALWRRGDRNALAPVKAAWLQDWITQHFPCWDESRGAYMEAPRQLGSWILTMVRAGVSDLPVISDKTGELI